MLPKIRAATAESWRKPSAVKQIARGNRHRPAGRAERPCPPARLTLKRLQTLGMCLEVSARSKCKVDLWLPATACCNRNSLPDGWFFFIYSRVTHLRALHFRTRNCLQDKSEIRVSEIRLRCIILQRTNKALQLLYV
jgi:hypothetical protein